MPHYRHGGPPRVEDEILQLLTMGERLLLERMEALEQRMEVMSKEVDDLNAAVDKMTNAVTAVAAELQTLAGEVADNNEDPAAMEAAADKISILADTLTNALPPAPAPQPAP